MLNDKQLQQAVADELAWTPSVTSSDIGVTARNGIVTLSGNVPSYWEKLAAEKAVQNVKGVKAVAEEIMVRLSSSDIYSDEKIAERALVRLNSDVSVPLESVKVKVDKGWVTLTGNVDWNYQKTAAGSSVQKITGLIGLANDIVVKPHVQPSEVRAKITKALERTASFDVNGITIKVDGGKVNVGGDVENRYERDLIVDAAWAVPGVSQVKDDLNINWGF